MGVDLILDLYQQKKQPEGWARLIEGGDCQKLFHHNIANEMVCESELEFVQCLGREQQESLIEELNVYLIE